MLWLIAYFRELKAIHSDVQRREQSVAKESDEKQLEIMVKNSFVLYAAPIPPLARFIERRLFDRA